MSDHKHLARLERVWSHSPIFFITVCTQTRRRELATAGVHEICRECWQVGAELHGWIVGRYVLMPDHVHFFCAAKRDDFRLETSIGKWKEWVAKYANGRLGIATPLWQKEFFDHLLRSGESYEEKWNYVRQNPVRAGLVRCAEDWPYQGELNNLRFD